MTLVRCETCDATTTVIEASRRVFNHGRCGHCNGTLHPFRQPHVVYAPAPDHRAAVGLAAGAVLTVGLTALAAYVGPVALAAAGVIILIIVLAAIRASDPKRTKDHDAH